MLIKLKSEFFKFFLSDEPYDLNFTSGCEIRNVNVKYSFRDHYFYAKPHHFEVIQKIKPNPYKRKKTQNKRDGECGLVDENI